MKTVKIAIGFDLPDNGNKSKVSVNVKVGIGCQMVDLDMTETEYRIALSIFHRILLDEMITFHTSADGCKSGYLEVVKKASK